MFQRCLPGCVSRVKVHPAGRPQCPLASRAAQRSRYQQLRPPALVLQRDVPDSCSALRWAKLFPFSLFPLPFPPSVLLSQLCSVSLCSAPIWLHPFVCVAPTLNCRNPKLSAGLCGAAAHPGELSAIHSPAAVSAVHRGSPGLCLMVLCSSHPCPELGLGVAEVCWCPSAPAWLMEGGGGGWVSGLCCIGRDREREGEHLKT